MSNKILIKVNSTEDLKYDVKGFILGLNKYSVLFEKSFNFDEISKLRKKYPKKEIFVSLNRCIYNSELEEYKSILKELDKLGLTGIIVGDIAPLTYNLNTRVFLDQMHLNNSYLTIKHFANNNVSGVVLTNDITISEINKIKKENENTILLKQVFGLEHLSTSTRSFLTNYKKHFNIKKDDKINLIKENNSDNYYNIIEDYFGTHILTYNPINLLKYIEKIKCDYFIIDTYLIKGNLDIIYDAFLKNDASKAEEINKVFNANEGFINKKTIYRVKKDD